MGARGGGGGNESVKVGKQCRQQHQLAAGSLGLELDKNSQL